MPCIVEWGNLKSMNFEKPDILPTRLGRYTNWVVAEPAKNHQFDTESADQLNASRN